MEVNAKVIQVLEPTKYTSRRDGSEQYIYGFVVETINEQYQKKMYMQVFGTDKWTQFNIQVGKEYNLRFDVGSREYNGRWFTELTCWNCTSLDGGENAQKKQKQQVSQPAPQTTQQSAPQTGNNDDDIPF